MTSPQKKSVKLVVCTPTLERSVGLSALIQQMKAAQAANFVHVDNFADILEHLEQCDGGVVVLSIVDKDELLGALQFLSQATSRVENNKLKLVALCSTDHPRITSLLKTKGVSEILDFSISLKALQHKIKQQVQSQLLQLESNPNEAGNTKSVSRTGEASKTAAAEVRFLDSAEHDSDFWIVLNPKHVRFAIGKWLMNFAGPGPNAGTWEDAGLERDGERGWRFVPKSQNDSTFYKSSGAWVFYGNCPEFSWEMKYWYFSAKRPYFAFVDGENVRYERIWVLDQGGLALRKNSQISEGFLPAIQESIEASIRLQNERFKGARATAKDDVADSEVDDYTVELEKSIERLGELESEKSAEVKRAQEAFDRAVVSLAIASKNGVKERFEAGIELIELRSQQAILTVPADLLRKGDLIELEASFKKGRASTKVSFMAKTKIIEAEDEDCSHPSIAAAVCDLDQNVEAHFKELVDVFQQRRQELLDFFFKAKGG